MTRKQVAEALSLSERELNNALPEETDIATLEDQLLQVESEIEACDTGVCYLTGAQIDALHDRRKGIEARLELAYEEMQDENQEDRT